MTELRKRVRSKRPSKEKMIEAIHKNGGNVKKISQSLKIAYQSVYTFSRDYDIKHEFQIARDMLLDDAESALHERATKGKSDACLIFLLKTKGQSRGYIERHQVDMTVAPPTSVNIISVAAQDIAGDIKHE